MSRTERLLELMTLIKAQGGGFTVQEMADQFGVSRRTMLRDLQSLSAMGLPLSASPGPGGGYSLAFKQRSVTLSLSAEEAVGLIASYEAFQDSPSPLLESNVSAIIKLRAALAPDVVLELDRLRERLAVIGLPRMYDAPFLRELLSSSLSQTHLRITYESRTGKSERLIFPYGLIAGIGFWYCGCYDYKRKSHVWLRADRITRVQHASELQPRESITLKDWLHLSSTGKIDSTDPNNVRVHASVSARGMKMLSWSAFREGLQLHEDGSATIDMIASASNLEFYARQFLKSGAEVRVKSPERLVKIIHGYAKEIIALYK